MRPSLPPCLCASEMRPHWWIVHGMSHLALGLKSGLDMLLNSRISVFFFFKDPQKTSLSVFQAFVSGLDSICQRPSAVPGSQIGPCGDDGHGDTFQKGHIGTCIVLPPLKCQPWCVTGDCPNAACCLLWPVCRLQRRC